MSLCIVGAGNMGKRYAAVCKSEDIQYEMIDKGEMLTGVDKYIIATPTDTHADVLCYIGTRVRQPVSILIEKPIDACFSTGLRAVEAVEALGHRVYMVNNYAYYSDGITEGEGDTHYDFYNSGKDGIAADCIQLLHLAKNGVGYLKNENPIWDCMINGTQLNRELIDLCYVKMIKDFYSDGKLYGRLWGRQDIEEAHRKVLEYEKSTDRDSSEKHLDQTPWKMWKTHR
jgi:hypothetical protein